MSSADVESNLLSTYLNLNNSNIIADKQVLTKYFVSLESDQFLKIAKENKKNIEVDLCEI